MNFPRLTSTLAATALLLGGPLVLAQTSPKLTISNAGTSGTVIELDPASKVEINAAGDLTVTCKLNTSGACPNVGAGAGGSTGTNPPTATLTASATAVEIGQPFTLTWNSTNADACYSSAPATGATGWTGVVRNKSGSLSAGTSLTLSVGTHTFSIRCYNSTGSVTASSAPVTVTAATTPQPTAYCSEYYDGTPAMPTSPNFTAFNFTKVEVPYVEAFGVPPGSGTVPSSNKIPLPADLLNPVTQRYLAIPFTMTDDSGTANSQMIFDWIEGGVWGTTTGAITVTVSPCAGDFRKPTNGSDPDIYLRPQCRTTAPLTFFSGLSIASVTSLSGCLAPKDKLMYINMATYDMYGATQPTSSTCTNSATCGGAFTVK